MDKATYKRIDSLYRNLKQLPLLAVLGILVPILLPIVPLLSVAYLFLRSRLLSEIDSGAVAIDPVADVQSVKVGELSAIRKLEYIRNSGGRVWSILVIFVAVAIIVALLITFAFG